MTRIDSGCALIALVVAMMASGCGPVYQAVGGPFRGEPHELPGRISPAAQLLIDRAFADFDENDVIGDYHVHMISRDVNRRWISRCNPFMRARTMVYLAAARVRYESPTLEADHVERMVAQVRQFPRPFTIYLYAMDRSYYPDGSVDARHTNIYVDNAAVYEVHRQHPDIFVPVISVHPFRSDAIDQLRLWAGRGVRHVKWLPNSMGINPASPRLDAFYRAMIELDMVLLTHTGDEDALEEIDDELGNPLHLRRPLDMGLKVVALHSASNGDFIDYENPRHFERIPGHELLLRMLDEPRYAGLLFGDTASMVFFNHLDEPLEALLARPDLHHRFVHGSDYPLSAINMAIWTSALHRDGFIDADERRALNEIYFYNPMLFDFIVQRTVRHPRSGQRLGKELFTIPRAIR
jgi:uncharacterized protein